MSLQFPNDPNNLGAPAVPATSLRTTPGLATLDDHVSTLALYAQDQWTLKRITASFALRYDHATSGYGQTVFPASLPTMQYSLAGFTVPASDGVNYNDITPRLGVTWDVRGNGKTSVKVNWGKYLNAAGISGVYSSANPARRTVNQLTRNWNDTNGNRKVDCDLLNPAANGECGGFALFNADFSSGGDLTRVRKGSARPRRQRHSHRSRDDAVRPDGTGHSGERCRRTATPTANRCSDGWGHRRGKRQFGIAPPARARCRGCLLKSPTTTGGTPTSWRPTSSAWVATSSLGPAPLTACDQALLNYSSPSYDFYSVTAPTDPNLPGGGGYKILGLNDVKTARCRSVSIPPRRTWTRSRYTFKGVDTNFNWRAPQRHSRPGGLEHRRHTARLLLRHARRAQRSRANRRRVPGRLQNAAAVPDDDQRFGVVYDPEDRHPRQHGVPVAARPEITATMTFSKNDITWNPNSAARATTVCATATNGVGCLGGSATTRPRLASRCS